MCGPLPEIKKDGVNDEKIKKSTEIEEIKEEKKEESKTPAAPVIGEVPIRG